jgi:hypothetical protein
MTHINNNILYHIVLKSLAIVSFSLLLFCVDLESTHFDDFHEYSIEWQPGPGGYLEWYLIVFSCYLCARHTFQKAFF